MYCGMTMICQRAFFAEFIALYDRPSSYKLLKKPKTLVILGVTRLIFFCWQYICIYIHIYIYIIYIYII